MPKVEKSGYKKWWPMKELMGTSPDGKRQTAEVYRNMVTGESHHPVDGDGNLVGWNGEPPALESGDKVPETDNEKFRTGYDGINWDGGRLVNGKWVVGETK